jgi:hypothetical protein
MHAGDNSSPFVCGQLNVNMSMKARKQARLGHKLKKITYPRARKQDVRTYVQIDIDSSK